MKRLLPILLLLGIYTGLQSRCAAQKNGDFSSKNKKAIQFYEAGDAYYRSGQMLKAENSFRNAIQVDTAFAEAYFVLSQILIETGREKEGSSYLKMGLHYNDRNFKYGYKTVADLDKKNGYYEDSERYYRLFLEKYTADTNDYAAARRGIAESKLLALLVKNPVPYNPENAGPNINTKYNDYHPALSVDGKRLIFCRTEPPVQAPTCPGRNGMLEDFYFSQRDEKNNWEKALNAGPPLNSGCNEGTPFITPDGRYMYFAACERQDGLGRCDIYLSERAGDSWSTPKNVGAPVNSPHWESQPSFSSDGKTLYFVSNRPGGYGKMDIYKSELQADGKFGPAQNLGPKINTAENDQFPFIHPDDQTFYFVSAGHLSIGGDDIQYCRRQPDGNWGYAQNIGYPINSSDNEQALIVSADGEWAYVTSAREGGYGGFDIYRFNLYPQARPYAVTYLKGNVTDKTNGKPLEARFELIDLASGKTVVASRSDKVNGEFLVSLPTNKNYALNVSRDGYLFHSENFALQGMHEAGKPFEKKVELSPIRKDDPVVLKNVFFATAEYTLLPESKAELDKLVEFLNKNATLKIEIGGHTDNAGSDELNKKLSENRARSVYDFLVQAGINKARLSYKGYGSSKPVADNGTEAGRAQNRRTEFKIVE